MDVESEREADVVDDELIQMNGSKHNGEYLVFSSQARKRE